MHTMCDWETCKYKTFLSCLFVKLSEEKCYFHLLWKAMKVWTSLSMLAVWEMSSIVPAVSNDAGLIINHQKCRTVQFCTVSWEQTVSSSFHASHVVPAESRLTTLKSLVRVAGCYTLLLTYCYDYHSSMLKLTCQFIGNSVCSWSLCKRN